MRLYELLCILGRDFHYNIQIQHLTRAVLGIYLLKGISISTNKVPTMQYNGFKTPSNFFKIIFLTIIKYLDFQPVILIQFT